MRVQVGSAMACTVEQARAAAAEADRAAQMARVFEVRAAPAECRAAARRAHHACLALAGHSCTQAVAYMHSHPAERSKLGSAAKLRCAQRRTAWRLTPPFFPAPARSWGKTAATAWQP